MNCSFGSAATGTPPPAFPYLAGRSLGIGPHSGPNNPTCGFGWNWPSAARGQEPHRTIAGQIADGFLAWVAERLHVDREADQASQSALLLATVDGLVLLSAVGHGEAADRALANSMPRVDEEG